jgi:hypothetical protein
VTVCVLSTVVYVLQTPEGRISAYRYDSMLHTKEFLPYGRALEQERVKESNITHIQYLEAYLGSSGCYRQEIM